MSVAEDSARDHDVPPGFMPLPGNEVAFTALCGPLYVKCAPTAIGLRLDERHLNFTGNCHGGMVAALADLQGALLRSLAEVGDRVTPTVSLSIAYLAPVPAGCWLEVRSELLKRTRNLLFGQGVILANGEIIARVDGIYKIGGPAEGRPVRLLPDSIISY